MKKIIATAILIYAVFAPHAYGQNNPLFGTAPATVKLNKAIDETIIYLNETIPPNQTAAVLAITSEYPRLSEYTVNRINDYGAWIKKRNFKVVTRSKLRKTRKQMAVSLSGEVSEETAQTAGRRLGAQVIITGSIIAENNNYTLQVKALSVNNGEVLGIHEVEMRNDSQVKALTEPAIVQGFDDLPYPNPDMFTYLQQEMTSLMRFQADNDINIPLFASATYRTSSLSYKSSYMDYLYSDFLYNNLAGSQELESADDTLLDLNLLLGVQFKIHRYFYIPVFYSLGTSQYYSYVDNEWVNYEDTAVWNERTPEWNSNSSYTGKEKVPFRVWGGGTQMFLASGLFINTDTVKGGIYLGGFLDARGIHTPYGDETISRDNGQSFRFKMALVPLINTSEWKYIGKALNSILGYLGNGDAVMFAEEEKGDSKTVAFFSALNAGLDLTFNNMHFGPLSLKAQALYSRGNFNAVAKNNIYGAKIQGTLSNFPFGFSLEGGYRDFFAVPQWFVDEYTGTGYFNGSIFFPFKKITFGVIYGYDNINQSQITFAVSTNFLSGFFGYNPHEKYDKKKFNGYITADMGGRYRHGGWNAF